MPTSQTCYSGYFLYSFNKGICFYDIHLEHDNLLLYGLVSIINACIVEPLQNKPAPAF